MAKFEYNEAAENDPIRIEQVWAEKPAGGVVHVTEDMPATTPVSLAEDGTFEVQKIMVVKSNKVNTNQIQFKKSTFSVGDTIHVVNEEGVEEIRTIAKVVESFNTVELEGGNIPFSINEGTKLYSTTTDPVYITGNDLKAADGEYQPVRLINGANVRKETAVITEEQAAQMKGIHLV